MYIDLVRKQTIKLVGIRFNPKNEDALFQQNKSEEIISIWIFLLDISTIWPQ